MDNSRRFVIGADQDQRWFLFLQQLAAPRPHSLGNCTYYSSWCTGSWIIFGEWRHSPCNIWSLHRGHVPWHPFNILMRTDIHFAISTQSQDLCIQSYRPLSVHVNIVIFSRFNLYLTTLASHRQERLGSSTSSCQWAAYKHFSSRRRCDSTVRFRNVVNFESAKVTGDYFTRISPLPHATSFTSRFSNHTQIMPCRSPSLASGYLLCMPIYGSPCHTLALLHLYMQHHPVIQPNSLVFYITAISENSASCFIHYCTSVLLYIPLLAVFLPGWLSFLFR